MAKEFKPLTCGQRITIERLYGLLEMDVPSGCDGMDCDNARILISELYTKVGDANRFPPRDLRILKSNLKYKSILH